jgi:hypothetical protein
MSLVLAGAQRATLASVPSQTAWVWAGWVRRDADADDGERTFLSMDNGNWDQQSSVYVIGTQNAMQRWRAGTGDGAGTGTLFEPVVVGTWYYVMMRYADGVFTVRTLADGASAWGASNVSGVVSVQSPTHISFGARSDGSGALTGAIASSKLWSGTLPTDEQVLAERLTTAVANPTGLWASYDFLENGLGRDRSDNQRHLTLVGTPTHSQSKPTDLTISTAVATVGATGCDYTSLSAAEAGEQRDLVAAGIAQRFVCTAFEDTTGVVVEGWTTSATSFIEIEAAEGAEARMPVSTSEYRLLGYTNALTINEEYVVVRNIRLETSGDDNNLFALTCGFGIPIHVVVDGCVLRIGLDSAMTYGLYGRAVSGGVDIDGDFVVRNCFIILRAGLPSGAEQLHGLWSINHTSGRTYAYNNTVINLSPATAAVGIQDGYGDTTALNNVVVGFDGGALVDLSAPSNYNATDDSTSVGANSRTNQTFSFVDFAGGDYRLTQTDAGARGFGTDLSGASSYPFSTGFGGTTRIAPWDIGATETGIREDVSQVAASGGDYTSLSAWEAGEQKNLVTAKRRETALCSTFDDTLSVLIGGWTTSLACYPTIEALDNHNGVWGASYRLVVTNPTADGVLTIHTDHVRVRGIQIQHTETGSGAVYRNGIAPRYLGVGGTLVVERCIVRGVITAGVTHTIGISAGNDNATAYISNNRVQGYVGTANRGIAFGQPPAGYAYNNTVLNCTLGMDAAYGHTVRAKNNLVDRRGLAGALCFTIATWHVDSSHNASDDASAADTGATGARINQTFTFKNADSDDYRLTLDDLGARRFGADLSADSAYPFATDARGAVRHASSWDIGAFQSPEVVVSQIAASGGDYTSLAAWESAQQRDLVALNEVAVAECQSFNDTASVTVDGWTTDDDRYVNVRAATGAEAQVPWSTSAYRLTASNVWSIDNREDYTRIQRLQLENNNPSAFGGFNSAGVNALIEGCVVRSTAVTGNMNGVQEASAGNLIAVNNVVYGWNGMGVTSGAFIGGGLRMYNCTVFGCGSHGVNRMGNDGNNITTVKNTLSFNNGGNDFNGAYSTGTTNNASDDATAPGTDSRINQTFTFVDAAGGDYRLASTDAGARGHGVNLSTDPTYPFNTDFDGELRTEPWDIGALIAALASGTGFGRAVVNLTGQNPFRISQNPASGFRVRIE